VKRSHERYELDDDLRRLDLERVHGWLTRSYWSPGVSRDVVERAARGSSLVVGAYLDGQQVGYLRVVSDKTTFAWIADVWVDEPHRGHGLARAMVIFALEHAEHQGLRRWVLATRDAHEIYAACGFELLPEPQRWMIRRDDGGGAAATTPQ
jgi:GNAT superfamily N-acetyltransferase